MQSEKLFKQKGFLSAPVQNPGKTLPTKIAEAIRTFNKNYEVSRAVPGMIERLLLICLRQCLHS